MGRIRISTCGCIPMKSPSKCVNNGLSSFDFTLNCCIL